MSIMIGMPNIDIAFKHMGTTAIKRGEKGQLILVLKEDLEGENIDKFLTIGDFTQEKRETFSEKNQRYILDALTGLPRELYVIRYNSSGVEFEEDTQGNAFEYISSMDAVFNAIKSVAKRNCWITIAEPTDNETDELVAFIGAENKFKKKRYKALVYNPKKAPDNMHIVNFTTEEFKYKGEDELIQSGVELIPRMAGALAGQSFNSSIIAKVFTDIEYVSEPEDLDEAVDKGEFFLYSDEGEVRVARGVNSLTTVESQMSQDMKFITIVEQMDLIFSDIYTVWNRDYKGKYKNNLDNQMLLVSAIKAYLKELEGDQILDKNFINDVYIDKESQKLANIPIYGTEEVESWDESKLLEMTVGTNVYLELNIKMLNTMEDIYIDIFM